jgi:hypothetical protein
MPRQMRRDAESAAVRADQGQRRFHERTSRGYERAAGGHGGLTLRRVLGDDGSQARGARATRYRVGASHLRVRRVRP